MKNSISVSKYLAKNIVFALFLLSGLLSACNLGTNSFDNLKSASTNSLVYKSDSNSTLRANVAYKNRKDLDTYIIVSHGAEINLQNNKKSAVITLYNTGNSKAEHLRVELSDSIRDKINVDSSSCLNLDAQASCEIKLSLKDNSKLLYNDDGKLEVSYKRKNDDNEKGISYISLIAEKANPQLTPSIDLESVIVGTAKIVDLKITNTGNRPISSISINYLSKQVSGFDELSMIEDNCSGTNLNQQQTCLVKLIYGSQKLLNRNNIQLTLSGNYLDENKIESSLSQECVVKVSEFN